MFLFLAATAAAFVCTLQPGSTAQYEEWKYSGSQGQGYSSQRACQQSATEAEKHSHDPKPTDGEEPSYTTEPVTQQVPHCAAGEKLMMFDPACCSFAVLTTGDANAQGSEGGWTYGIGQEGHPGRWLPAGDHPGEVFVKATPTYRCLPDDKKATCLLFDKDDHPTEQVSCDDPRVKWPTSATVSLYKSDGTCIGGACAVKFPDNPKLGQCWMDGDTKYCFTHGSWQFVPKETGMLACPPGSHLHPAQMSEFAPDTRGGPLPKADGLCHRDDDTDAPVLPHGRKLQAQK